MEHGEKGRIKDMFYLSIYLSIYGLIIGWVHLLRLGTLGENRVGRELELYCGHVQFEMLIRHSYGDPKKGNEYTECGLRERLGLWI